MMFILSKVLAFVVQPLFWLGLCWALGLLLLGRRRRWGLGLLWGGLLGLVLLGFRAGPDALLRPLENRYPVPSARAVAQHLGVIVLGGAVDHPDSFLLHHQVPLNDGAERMTVPLPWMRQNPRLLLIFSGGEGRLRTTGVSEGRLAQAFYKEQGVDMARVRLEEGSRTTRENAQRVVAMLGPEGCASAQWLLVTSAWHMSRAMAEFERRGCAVTPYPVDFRTGAETSWTEYSIGESLPRWQAALHEWLGQGMYALTRP